MLLSPLISDQVCSSLVAEGKWLMLRASMNSLLATALLVAVFLGSVSVGQKFALKKNPDGTYLLVPAGSNASGQDVVDIKSLPPIPVANSVDAESPGVNSQSTQASPPSPSPSAVPPTAKTTPTVKVQLLMPHVLLQCKKSITFPLFSLSLSL